MSSQKLIDDFFHAFFAEFKDVDGGIGSRAAKRLGVSNPWISEAMTRRTYGWKYARPHKKTVESFRANGGHELQKAATALLIAYEKKAIMPTDLSSDLFGDAKVVRFDEARQRITGRLENRSVIGDLQTLTKRYIHAALQLEVGAFHSNTLAQSIGRKDELGVLEASAMVDLIQGAWDLQYFTRLAAAVRKNGKSASYHDIPLHPLGVIVLASSMYKRAPTKDDQAICDLARMLGRSTAFVFWEYNEQRTRYTSRDIASLIERCIQEPFGLYKFLTPKQEIERRELREPALVGAASSIAAGRLALSLMAATSTLIELERIPACLEAVIVKVAELVHQSWDDLAERLGEALDALEDVGGEPDHTALRMELTLALTALFREDGIWFIFNDQIACLNKCGSLIQQIHANGGKEIHRYIDPANSCKLPLLRGDKPIWSFRGAGGVGSTGDSE